MSIGLDGNQISGVLKLFCHHLVGFTWYEGEANDNGDYLEEPVAYLGSGFIVEIHDTFWLATAGHIFKDHDKRMERAGYQTTKPRLFDHWSPSSTVLVPIPFDFFDPDLSTVFVAYDDELGLDFALMMIPPLIAAALVKTIKPFRRIDWIAASEIEFDFHAVLGTPIDQARQTRKSGNGKATIFTAPVPSLIFLKETVWPSPYITESTLPRFVAEIHPKCDTGSIVGMSGGPILGFKRQTNGELKYYPVAIQSSWNSTRRVVAGCPLSIIGPRIENLIDGFLR